MAPRPSSPIISYLPSFFRAHPAKRYAGSTPLAHKRIMLADTPSTLSHLIAGQVHFCPLANREVIPAATALVISRLHRYCREDPHGGRLSQRTTTRLAIFDLRTIEPKSTSRMQ